MELILQRLSAVGDSRGTEGKLFVRHDFFCSTLEPVDRGLLSRWTVGRVLERKKKGITAIPLGRYAVRLSFSGRFSGRAFYKGLGGLLPAVIGVKGFEGVLIHAGNTVADTRGCILVGQAVGRFVLGHSRLVYEKLLREVLLPCRARGEEVFISIVR